MYYCHVEVMWYSIRSVKYKKHEKIKKWWNPKKREWISLVFPFPFPFKYIYPSLPSSFRYIFSSLFFSLLDFSWLGIPLIFSKYITITSVTSKESNIENDVTQQKKQERIGSKTFEEVLFQNHLQEDLLLGSSLLLTFVCFNFQWHWFSPMLPTPDRTCLDQSIPKFLTARVLGEGRALCVGKEEGN